MSEQKKSILPLALLIALGLSGGGSSNPKSPEKVEKKLAGELGRASAAIWNARAFALLHGFTLLAKELYEMYNRLQELKGEFEK